MDRQLPAGFGFAIGAIGLGLIGAFIALSVVIGEDFAIPAMIAAAIVAGITLRGPVGKALARWIEGSARGEAGQLPEENAAEIEDMRIRLVELEERLDFAERLLTRGRDSVPVSQRED